MKNFRKVLLSVFVAALAISSLPGVMQAQEPIDINALWAQLQAPMFDGSRVASVEGTVIKRDVATLTLIRGQLAFAQPVAVRPGEEGRTFAAAFKGKGHFRFEPVLAMEKQQLFLHAKQTAVDTDFSEAIFVFTDRTAVELEEELTFGSGNAVGLPGLYSGRDKDLKKYGINLEPLLLKSLLSSDPAPHAFFFAFLNTKKHGWLIFTYDEADPEQVELDRLDKSRHTIDIWSKFPKDNRRPQDVFTNPVALQEYVIQGYILDITIEENTNLVGRAEMTLEMKRAGERVLIFSLTSNLQVETVTDSKGQTLTFFQPKDPKDDRFFRGGYLAVVSPKPFPTETIALTFQYAGKRVVHKVGDGNYFCRSFGWYPALSLGLDSINSNTFASRANFDLTLRVPKKFDAVAVGEKIEEKRVGDYNLTRWKSEIPLAVAGFAYGEYKIQTETAGDSKVVIYANKHPDDVLRSIEIASRGLDQMSLGGPKNTGYALGSLSPGRLRKMMAAEIANALNLMVEYYGPYPYKTLSVSNITGGFGQGWPGLLYLSTLTFLDSNQRNQLGFQDQTGITDFFRAHEVSHQWWGHVVGWKSYHDQWLSEGFAEFSGNLYAMYSKNPQEYFRLLRQSRNNLMSSGQTGNPFHQLGPIYAGRRLSSGKYPRGYATIIYEKGGWVLHMIRMMLYDARSKGDPDARFKVMMKDFTSTYFNQAASTEDFKAIVEKHMIPRMDIDGNGSLDWFFNNWVYGVGIPSYTFSYSITPTPEGKYLLKGMIRQTDGPDSFRTILPLYFHQGKNKMRAGWLTVGGEGNQTPFEIPLGFKPDKVTVNDWEEVLANIRYQ